MAKFPRSRSFLPVIALLLTTLASPAFAGGHGHAQHENAHRFTPSAGLNSSNTSHWLNGIGHDEKNSFFLADRHTSNGPNGNGKIKTGTGGPFENVILENAAGGSPSTPQPHTEKIQTGTGGPFENVTSAGGTGGALKNFGFSFFKHRRAAKQ